MIAQILSAIEEIVETLNRVVASERRPALVRGLSSDALMTLDNCSKQSFRIAAALFGGNSHAIFPAPNHNLTGAVAAPMMISCCGESGEVVRARFLDRHVSDRQALSRKS
jgi:hypothetical protein